MTETLKTRLQGSGDRMTMHVLSIPSAAIAQTVAAAGADAVIIDREHGAIDLASAHAMIAATQGTDCAPIVRIPALRDAEVKQALDLGAEGICYPLIRTAAEAEWAVASLQYPPRGTRAFGPFLAHGRYGQTMAEYAASFGDRAVCVLLAETLEAVENIEAICAVPGQFDHPDFVAALSRLESCILQAGLPMGAVALDADKARAAFARGNRVIVGFDLFWIQARAAEAQLWCGSAMDSGTTTG